MATRLDPLAAAMAIALSGAMTVQADTQLDTVVVRANRDIPLPVGSVSLNARDIAAQRPYVSDTARLFSDAPGFSAYSAGGISSLPVIRGLNDDRIRVQVDGMGIRSACGNHMNPPLSYIDPTNVDSATVISGITPVSLGGDSIGGTIVVESADPVFADAGTGPLVNGSVSGFYRGNGSAPGVSASAAAANDHLSIAYVGSAVRSDNYKAGDGSDVKSSQYNAQNQAMSFAARGKDQLAVVNLGVQQIPYQGFPNARMDMVDQQSAFGNLRFERLFGWGKLTARAYYEHTEHEMNFLADKLPGDMPMDTDGQNMGYLIRGDIPLSNHDTLRIGNEYQRFRLDDWWPPVPGSMMMGPNTFENINNGERDRLGTFAEWEARWSSQWSSLLGARWDWVSMDTGDVQPYSNTSMMQAADIAAAAAFNAVDHQRTDNNFDLTALARYSPSQNSTFEAGYARKSRSPNLYERYAWGRGSMAMNMIGWFGDGNGYVGNIDLDPEVAHILSATASWHDATAEEWHVEVTPYYTYVKDYVDVDRCLVGMMGGCPLTGGMPQKTTNNFVYLQFANHDARLYGVDASAKALLASGAFGNVAGRGVLSYVRGQSLDTDDNLYHMMPLNATLALDHRWKAWTNTLEYQVVAAKDDVQAVRNETTTAGYSLVNLRTGYQWKHVRLDAGIENLFDRRYAPALGGAYLGDRRSQVWGVNVPGMGLSAYVGITVRI